MSDEVSPVLAGTRQRVVLGSRGSELARVQTTMAAAALQQAWPELEIEVKIIKTTGDARSAEPSDFQAGRKGLFTGEIERALSVGEIDVAVHSAKDLPSQATPGLELVAVLPRAGVEDVLVGKSHGGLMALPKGCVVGTGSVRRQCQLRWQRPDLNFFALRGNVPTRLRQLEENPWEAIILARAGLERLGYVLETRELGFGSHSLFAETLNTETFMPAGGQGVIALQIRSDDSRIQRLVKPVNDACTSLCLRAEREFLRLLHADCGTPVGVLATQEAGIMRVRGQIFDGKQSCPEQRA